MTTKHEPEVFPLSQPVWSLSQKCSHLANQCGLYLKNLLH